jgi:hypothetical protein
MTDEPNSRNHHEDLGAGAALPPELETLARRLSSDGALWQSRLPDAARVAERIRAIPGEVSQGATEGELPTPLDIRDRPGGGQRRPRTGPRLAPPGRGGQLIGLVAAVLVVALLASVFVALANRSGVGPIGQPTPTQAQPAPTQPQPTQPAPTATAATAAPTATPTGRPVLVYFSKQPDSYNDPNAVFPVHRTSPTLGVATYAIQQLIAGPTQSEAAAGYFTELKGALSGSSNCGGADFKIALDKRGATPQTGTATLRFCRQLSLPGDQSDPRIKAEITKTLTQFSNIKAVVILTRDGHCFGDLSGMDMCLQ